MTDTTSSTAPTTSIPRNRTDPGPGPGIVDQLLATLRDQLGDTALEPLAGDPGDPPALFSVDLAGSPAVVSVTASVGDEQFSEQLEPLARHLRQRAPTGPAPHVAVLVAPAIDERLVAHWLGATAGEVPDDPAVLVPLTGAQLRALAGTDLARFCQQVADDTDTVANEAFADNGARFAAPAARALLARVATRVTAATGSPRP